MNYPHQQSIYGGLSEEVGLDHLGMKLPSFSGETSSMQFYLKLQAHSSLKVPLARHERENCSVKPVNAERITAEAN